MPITPPRSGVQLISPAALLGNNQRNQRDNSLDQFLNFAFQQKFQESSQTFTDEQNRKAQAAANERTIAQLMAGGEIHDAELVNARYTDDPLPTFEFEGHQFVRGVDIAARQNAALRSTPISTYGGLDLLEGVVMGDIMGATAAGSGARASLEGTGQISGSGTQPAGSLDHFAVGDKELVMTLLEEASAEISNVPGAQAAMQAYISRVQRDDRFSRAEEKEILEEFNIGTVESLSEAHHAVSEANLDRQAAYGTALVEAMSRRQMIQTDATGRTGLRDLDPYEAGIIARKETGLYVRPDEEDWLEANAQNFRPRTEAKDQSTAILAFRAGGQVRSDLSHTSMLAKISNDIFGQGRRRGRVADTPLSRQIKQDTGQEQLSQEIISQWLQSNASSHYRGSYGLAMTVGSTRAEVLEHIRNGGSIPISLKGALETPGSWIIDDGTDVSIVSDFSPTRPISQGERSQYEAAAQEMASEFGGMTEIQRGALDAAFLSGDIDTLRGDLTINARLFAENAQRASNPEQAALDAKVAELYTILAGLSPEELMIFRDSVWTRIR